MKIKSSKKNTHLVLLSVCALIVLGLTLLQSFDSKKKVDIEVPDIEQKTSLSALQITVKEKDYLKLKKKRNEALAVGVLESSDNDYVPAIITFNGEDYKADLRLKGDWTDHLAGDKWSFRIKLKNDKTIFGMRKFSVHHPKTRGYINEWLYHKVNKSEELIGLRYNFVKGFLHIKLKNEIGFINKDVGIYAVEEAFDKRTIENNKRKAGVILRVSEQYYWKEMKQAWRIGKETGYRPHSKRRPHFDGALTHEYISTFGLGNILEDEALNQQFVHAKNLLETFRNNNLKVSEVFDAKKLALHTALNNLFGATHGLLLHNLRFYYNPTSSKLEPIAFDGNPGYKLSKFHHYTFTDENMDNEYRKELIKALEYVSTPEYLEALLSSSYDDVKGFENELEPEFGEAAFIEKESYIHNQTILRQELERLKQL